MNTEATAAATLPGNRTGSVPDLTVADDDGNRQTMWDFTAFAPEHQTLDGATELLRDNGWRPADLGGYWHQESGRWILRVQSI
jgi:hypothetical protein